MYLFRYFLFMLACCSVLISTAQETTTTTLTYPVLDKELRTTWTLAQQQQALKKAIPKAQRAQDSVSLQQLFQLQMKQYYKAGNSDSLQQYAHQYIQLSKALHDLPSTWKGYHLLGQFFRKEHEYAQALQAYESKLRLCQQLKDTVNSVYTLQYVASLQSKLGLYFDSEATAIEGLSLIHSYAEPQKLTSSEIGLNNQLGIIYKERGATAEARHYYEESLALKRNSNYAITLYNNIANTYITSGDYATAAKLLDSVISNTTDTIAPKSYARLLDNLGRALYQQQDTTAWGYLQQGLQLRTQLDYPVGMYSSYYHLAVYQQTFGHSTAALSYAKQALAIVNEHQLQEELLEVYPLLIQLGATEYAQPYLELQAQTQGALQAQANKYMAYKYNYQKEHEEAQANAIKYLESDLERETQERHKLIWQGIAFLGCIIFVAFVWGYRNYSSKKVQEKVYATETRIGKQLHDEIANDIYQTMNKVQHTQLGEEDLLNQLDSLYQRTRTISKANSAIATELPFGEVLDELLQSYRTEDVILVTTGLEQLDWTKLSEMRKVCLYRVLQELMTNMRKHSKAPLVKVSFALQQQQLRMEYTDTGVGTDLQHKSGLRYTENRIEAIGGSCTFSSRKGNGFKATIIL